MSISEVNFCIIYISMRVTEFTSVHHLCCRNSYAVASYNPLEHDVNLIINGILQVYDTVYPPGV